VDVQQKLNRVFCEVFDDPEIVISPEMTASDVEGWDSLSHVNLIIAIETRFAIKFTQKELLSFKNVGDLLNATAARVAAR
jgi:acyl carrier protein